MSTIATPRADRPEHRPDDAVGARGGDARRRILAIVPGLCLAAAGLAAQTGTIPSRIASACDAIGRAVLAPAEIPAGAITAFIGGPHLVWMVRRGGAR